MENTPAIDQPVLEVVNLKGDVGRKWITLITIVSAIISVLGIVGKAQPQVAGSATLGVGVAEVKEIAAGWSAKKQILGHTLYNERNEKVGTIDDIIITPNKSVSYAIVRAGGFAGMRKHDVAIPVAEFKKEGGKFILPGATRDKIKEMPKFDYKLGIF